MNWEELVTLINNESILLKLTEPVQRKVLKTAQEELKTAQEELKRFYEFSNGLQEYIEGVGIIGEVIWNIERLVKENQAYRHSEIMKEIYEPFDNILFFGDAGNGDRFGYLIDSENKNNIISWNHENDERLLIATNLKKFVESWTTGKIHL